MSRLQPRFHARTGDKPETAKPLYHNPGETPDHPLDFNLVTRDRTAARPAVNVVYGGTVEPFAADVPQNPGFKRQAEHEKKDRERKNKRVLDEAVFILSQSATGRDVLERMTRAGFSIVFDDKETGDMKAGGLCDSVKKKILLHSHDNAEYLALLLGHECTHAVQSTQGGLFPNADMKPEEAIKQSFAIEADAYAQQTQIAMELFYGDPEYPDNHMRFEKPLQQMRQRFPDLVNAAEKAMMKKGALENGATAAAAFEAFYTNHYLRTFYEDTHMNWAEKYAEEIKEDKPRRLRHYFNRAADDTRTKKLLLHRGQPYLEKHLPSLSFSDTRHGGLTEKTTDRIRAFYAACYPNKTVGKLKNFGVHMEDAAAWIHGLRPEMQAVVAKAPKNPKK